MELKLRKDVKNNKAYYSLKIGDGIEYSVVNFGEVMRTAPKQLRGVTFEGWEAMPLKENGQLNSEIILRFNSKKELLESIKERHKNDMSIISAISEALKIKEPIKVESQGTFYNIKPTRVGSIGHTFYVKEGRATRYESEYSKEKTALPLNACAGLSEVESLISVLIELRAIMKKSL
jgi:hypothetical protein